MERFTIKLWCKRNVRGLVNLKNIFIILLIFIIPNKSFGLIEVDITRGNLNPLPIAVSPLATDKDSKQKFKNEVKVDDLGAEISKVVDPTPEVT